MVRDEICTLMDEKEASSQLRGLLLDGGAKALCMDTERGTRAFMMRGIFVRQGTQSGWRMNVVLETNQESYDQWLDMVAAFLLDYAGLAGKLAGLFSVKYDGGEHYILDTDGFEQLLHSVNGTAGSFCSETDFHALAEQLCAPFDARAGRLLLLVPTATVDYFMQHTSLKGLTAPELCMGSTQWEAVLSHKTPEDEMDAQWMRGAAQQPESDYEEDFPLSDAAFFVIGAASAALFSYSAYRVIRWVKRRRKGR